MIFTALPSCGCDPINCKCNPSLEKDDVILEHQIKQKKWDKRFLELATHVSLWSHDPSRKVGAVIVRPDKTIVSLGYNGFARGVSDSEDRYADRSIKYELVVHAEVNAILTARESLNGMTLYSTLLPCARCAAIIINSGIKRVVTYEDVIQFNNDKLRFDLASIQFEEAGVALIQHSDK